MRCRRRSTSLHDARGFTLIEVTAALLIFTVGVFAALQVSQALSERLRHSALRTRVASAVQERVDSLRAEGYSGVTVGGGSISTTFEGRGYGVTTAVSQYSPLVRQITVAAAPSSGTGPSHSLTIYLSQPW